MAENFNITGTPLRVLAIDYGTRQIGMAIGQTITGTATPLQTLPAKDGVPNWQRLEALIDEWRPDRILVGLPLNMDGSESDLCGRARKFARRIDGRFGVNTLMVDERLTTREAKSLAGNRGNYRENPVDNLAACLIFESWCRQPELALSPQAQATTTA